eukprot:9495656-Pyramimonas_sp.AAC.1
MLAPRTEHVHLGFPVDAGGDTRAAAVIRARSLSLHLQGLACSCARDGESAMDIQAPANNRSLGSPPSVFLAGHCCSRRRFFCLHAAALAGHCC